MKKIFKIGWLVIGGGAAPLLPFSDDFARADGDLANGWEYTAGKWTIASGAAVGTPGLGANVIVNGTFDADANWVKGTGWSIGGGVATKAAGASSTTIAEGDKLIAKQWYQGDFDISSITGGGFSSGYSIFGSYFHTTNGSKSDTWRAGVATAQIEGNAAGAANIDNVVMRQITLADMFATRDLDTSDVDVSVPLTHESRKQAGIVICLDDKDTPANFIIAFLRGGTLLYLEKCVAGTYTTLVGGTVVTYGAGKVLRVRKAGTTVQVFYDGSQVGTDQTVSDAGIKDNTRHGLFATHPNSSIGSFDAINPI